MCIATITATSGEGFAVAVTIEGDFGEIGVKLNGFCQFLADQNYTAAAPKAAAVAAVAGAKAEPDAVACGACGGPVWDNRRSKKSPKAPDYKCRDAKCGKGAWFNIDKDSGEEVLSAWK
jgi:hypothetical protein